MLHRRRRRTLDYQLISASAMFNVMQESAVVKMQAEQKNNNMLEIHLYDMAIARGKLAKQFVMEP